MNIQGISMLKHVLCSAFLITTTVAQNVYAQDFAATCNPALLRYEQREVRNSERLIDIMSITDRENYDETKRTVTANSGGRYGLISGYFAGNYEEFDAKRNRFFQQNGYTAQARESSNVVISKLDSESQRTIRQCLMQRNT
ncbi:MAG: hypothetical protein ACKO96_06335, partial [Flammeovirgaceae bacterium]